MKPYQSLFQNTALFAEMRESEAEQILSCLSAKTQSYEKNDVLLQYGVSTRQIGILQSGSALVIQEDFWGNRNIIANLLPNEVFAEAFACCADMPTNVSVVAQKACTVLWLNVEKILSPCPSACGHHTLLIRNLLSELAKKNLRLNEKLTHMAKRTTRQKVLSYLSAQAQRHNASEFDIPFNRQQLADYLCVERSALSAELSKLQRERLLRFERSHFLLNPGS